MNLLFIFLFFQLYNRVEIFHLIWSKIWAVWAVFLDNYAQNLASKWAVFELFYLKKPLKPLILKQDFERNCLKKNRSNRSNLARFLSGFFR